MKKSILLLAVIWWAFPIPICRAAVDPPVRFSVSLKGGAAWLWDTDWSRELAAADRELAAENLGPDLTVQRLDDTISGITPRFDLEFMVRLTPRVRIGASIGYQAARWETGGFYTAPGWSGSRSEMQTDHRFKVSLVPVQVLLAYRLAQAGSRTLDLAAGISWNRLSAEEASILDRSFTSAFTGKRVRNLQHTDVVDASGSGWGFSAGLDFEQALSARLALVAAGDVRLGPRVTARGRKQQHEQLYINGGLISDFSYPEEDGDVPPVSRFDYSGVGIRIGLKITL